MPNHHVIDVDDTAEFSADWILFNIDPDDRAAVQADVDDFAGSFTLGEHAAPGTVTAVIDELHGPGGGWPSVTFSGPIHLISAAFGAYMEVKSEITRVFA